MATLPLTHLTQASVATNHRTHMASRALISHAWYPDATAAHLAQAIFLLMMSQNLVMSILYESRLSEEHLYKEVKGPETRAMNHLSYTSGD